MEEVSLYVPCFNSAKTISLCLQGVLKQTYPIKEVVVIDDGSYDDTAVIASHYPVRLVRHDENRGLAAVRNAAIKSMNSEFLASLDADCIPEEDWLANLIKAFNDRKMAGTGGKLLERDCSSVFNLWRSVHMKQYWEEKDIQPPFLFGSNTIFRRGVLIKAGFYNENFKSNYEDVDICNRLKKAGYFLKYEPNAIAYHLKNDDICSLLDTYWKWHHGYYQEQKYYSSWKRFLFKVKDNIGLANRYLEEDIASDRQQLIYLNFLLALHHSLKDFEYFVIRDDNRHLGTKEDSMLRFWISLIDLTFFCHFERNKATLSTLMPQKNTLLQNFLALDLLLGGVINETFKKKAFRQLLYKHLFLSVYRINDPYLLDKLSNLSELHPGWNAFLHKKHPYLQSHFLDTLFINFKHWIGDLTRRFPDILEKIEISAEETDSSVPKMGQKETNDEEK